MKHLVLVVAIAGCHFQPSAPKSPEQRVQVSLERWGKAVQSGNQAAVLEAEDTSGQLAIPYVAIKAIASQAPGGAEAVEQTAFTLVVSVIFQSLFPGVFGEPFQTWDAYVPAGSLGPALVDAGLATRTATHDQTSFAIVEVPWQSSIGKLEEASKRHRAKLVEQRAWTCKLHSISKSIASTNPILTRGATVSSTIFGGWLDKVEALWLVRADCESGPALFIVTARKDGKDRILLAKLL